MQLNYTIIEMFGIAGNAYQSELGTGKKERVRERKGERERGRGKERE